MVEVMRRIIILTLLAFSSCSDRDQYDGATFVDECGNEYKLTHNFGYNYVVTPLSDDVVNCVPCDCD